MCWMARIRCCFVILAALGASASVHSRPLPLFGDDSYIVVDGDITNIFISKATHAA